jgi:transposase-like protein
VYLNNMVEQDHRRVESRVSPMLGFKTFQHARRVLAGIELNPKAQERPVRGSVQLRHDRAGDFAPCSRRLGATEPL